MFTDYYAENSCTAGRSSFITGQSPLRTGLSKVGMPGVPGRAPERGRHDRPGAESRGLCDRPIWQEPLGRPDEYLPTNHGFDEFYGNLYHLNAEEEPEQRTWPKRSRIPQGSRLAACPKLRRRQNRRHWTADKKRMETIDDETTKPRSISSTPSKADKPFFVWMNTTRMHLRPMSVNRWKPAGLRLTNTQTA